jgi:hypothetical protein
MNGRIQVVIEYLHSVGFVGARAPGTSRQRTWATAFSAWSFAFFVATMMANAQFKVVGPAPYSPTVAREKIRTLLEGMDPSNRQKTVETLYGLLSWYRDILDEELIAAWQKDSRANVVEAVPTLADSRLASAVVEFSWREKRQTAFNITYAPMFSNLMTRFPESAQPFLDDLRQTPDLSDQQAETVCRILLDMPDIGTWRTSALQILPHYRPAAERLLVQDMHGSDQEKNYQALRWLADLKIDVPGNANEQPSPRRRLRPPVSSAPGGISAGISPDDEPSPRRRSRPSLSSAPGGVHSVNQTEDDQTASVASPPRASLPRDSNDLPPAPSAMNSISARPPLPTAPAPAPPLSSAPIPSAPPPSALPPYSGAKAGTLESSGAPIAQNAEYVFRNLPLVKMQLDYDTKTWDARLVPGDGQTQKLIVRNKSSGPQKRCVVHWSVVP